jgi:hypothetical protein
LISKQGVNVGDNPGIIITEQMIDAQRRLMTEMRTQPLDPKRVRNAARALRTAQISAGWSASESEADAREIIRGLLYGDLRDPQLSKPHELSPLLARAVAEGFGFPIEFYVPDGESSIH